MNNGRQDRRRSDKYPLTKQNTKRPNTAKARSMTTTGVPSKHPLREQPQFQFLTLDFQLLAQRIRDSHRQQMDTAV